MTIQITHTFVSAEVDSGNVDLVQPSHWNSQHTLVGLGGAAELNVGTGAGTVAAGDHSHATLPTADEKAAMTAAATPSALNAFLTASEAANHIHAIADVTGLAEALTSGRILRVTASPAYGEYATIASACTAAAALSPDTYVVQVAAGTYLEAAISVASNTHVVGDSQNAVVITPSGSGYHLFTPAAGASLAGFTVAAMPDATKAAVSIVDLTGTVELHNIVHTGPGTGIDVSCTSADTSVRVTDCDVGGTLAGLRIRALGAAACFVDTKNLRVSGDEATLARGISVSGANAMLQMASTSAEAAPGHTGTGLYVEDGAQVFGRAGMLRGFAKNAHVANVGAAATLRLLAYPLRDHGTYALQVEHPGAVGVFNGTASTEAVDTAAAPGFTLNFTDVENNHTVITGSLYLGPDGSTITDASALIIDAAPMGLLSGGGLSPTGGLNASAASGVGYLRASGVVQRVEWATQAITMSPGETSYIYVNSAGVAGKSGSLPDLLTNIMLGRISAGASSLTAMGNLAVNINNYGNKVEDWLRYAVGPVYVSGSIVTENGTTARAVNVTAGRWYYGTVQRNPSALTAPTMASVYPVAGVPTIGYIGTVPNGVYDDGTNVVAMTASYYTKHDIYMASEGAFQIILFVHGQTQWATQDEAEASTSPTPLIVPDATPKIASFIMQQGVNSIVKIVDVRPLMFRSAGSSGGGTADHSNLLNLNADDHTQYLLVNGTRSMAGALNMGTNAITNVGLVDGVDVSAHAARHLPNGSDPITTAAAASLSNITTDAEGIQNSLARSDHTHAITGFEPTISTGTSAQYVRGDKALATLDKTAVGLGNVDNTADTDKPVSTTQSTAIGLKLDAANLPSSSVDSEVTLFSSTTGKVLKRATLTATVVKSTSGVLSAATAGTDYLTPTGSGTGLSGVELSANKNASGGYAGLSGGKLTGSQQTYGTLTNTACEGNDARLSDARTPSAHNQAETTITFTDITTGNADITKHGFLPKLGGGTTNFLRADGSWSAPGGGGAPGGSTTHVQYNNAGAFGGSANFTYDSATNTAALAGTNPKLNVAASAAEPSATAAGTLTVYAATQAGRVIPKWIGPSGFSTHMQSSLYENNICAWSPSTATAGLWLGTAGAGAGTFATTLPVSSTNRWLNYKRSRWANVVTTANQVLGQRNTEAMFFRGANAGEGGFFFFCRFGIETWTAASRLFVGMATASTVISAEPSALNNTMGFCVDAVDSSISFLTRNGTTATKAAIAGQPALAAAQGYEAYIFCKPADSVVYFRLDNVNTGATIIDSSTSTTLPVNTTMLTANALMSNAANALVTATQIGITDMYIEVDR